MLREHIIVLRCSLPRQRIVKSSGGHGVYFGVFYGKSSERLLGRGKFNNKWEGIGVSR